MLDPVKVERAEAEIDKFITSRSKAKEAANAEADLWRISERRHREKRRAEHRELWVDFHLGQAERLRRTMTALVEKHEAAAARLLEGSGAPDA